MTIPPARGWHSPSTLPALIAAALLMASATGCSTFKVPGNPFTKESKDSAAAIEGTYYTSEAGVKLYSNAGFSSSVLAELPQNQQVLRTGLDHGFAYVKVVGSNREGWVENTKLAWRPQNKSAAKPATVLQKPAPQAKTLAVPQSPALELPQTEQVNPAEQAEVQAITTAQPPAPVAVPVAAPEEQPETAPNADPSLFNPY